MHFATTCRKSSARQAAKKTPQGRRGKDCQGLASGARRNSTSKIAKKPTRGDGRPKDAERRKATEEERAQGRKQLLGRRKREETDQNEYACPYCRATIYSAVRSGTVNVAGHCGKQFRDRNGIVTRAFAHACPTCGTEVQSAKACGRIQSKHKKPDGKACPTKQWQAL